VSIKLFLFIALLQEPLFERFIDHRESAALALDAGAGGLAHEQTCLHGANLAHFWAMHAALESVGMVLLLRFAFPASELSADSCREDESGALTVELELLRHQYSLSNSLPSAAAQHQEAYASLGGTARAGPPAEAGESEMTVTCSAGTENASS